MKNFLPVMFSLFVLSACSTVPIPIPNTTGSSVVIIRDSGLTGAGCDHAIFLDTVKVGKVAAGESKTISVQPGTYTVQVGTGSYEGTGSLSSLCPNIILSQVVKVDNLPVVFRIGITSNMQTLFERVK